jgi:predicted lysophospholipase L1 biosynthesis ABC-type transport system permease subunit
MRVVGRAVFPAFGLGVFTPTGLGEGAAITTDVLPPDIFEPGTYSFAMVRFAPNARPDAVRRIADACALPDLAVNLCSSARTQPPPEIESYARVKNLPWVLTGILAALAAATLGHGLVATVRRRRRDLAILKTLGFVQRQVSSAVAWQASTLVIFALVGIPLGIAAGRWAWTLLANQLGIPAEPRVPMLAVAITVPAAIMLANLVAALPGRSASKTRAGLVLRTE